MFQLTIPVTQSTLDATKLALTKALGAVKSSHRAEAMARGFGFRAYAAFLERARSRQVEAATVDGAAFAQYLARHDFNAAGSTLYRAAAQAALIGVAKRFPTLTAAGFGMGQWRSDETPQERRARFAQGRSDLVSDYAAAPFLASLAFVSRVDRTKTIRPATNSYWLKHVAEDYECTYPDGENLGPVYVPNGLLIAAAIHVGFDVKPHLDDYGREKLNAGFNMAKTSLYDLDCEIHPDGARAQDRRWEEERRAARRSGYTYF
ncbi:hypothetical protein [Sphingobium sp.]|uniref:hypothetical protein n=1 Tax=Sphingobium sp. TaxID=1912891 RepID=UPI002B554454|nr:hypothetical protein [Sphingobium sp.]HUD92510.1 hypothetical protein [Sphingobium sp.]